MTRPPKSRQIVLDAAAAIVRERGAANLTFEELSEVSGVTRGGITYHFPTKRDLLIALLTMDLDEWQAREAMHLRDQHDDTSALLAEIRMHVVDNEAQRRFVSGMLSAVAHDPDLLDPIRAFHRARIADKDWTPAERRRHILRLAAEGLFWSEIFECAPLPPAVRAALVSDLEALAVQWSSAAASLNSDPDPSRSS